MILNTLKQFNWLDIVIILILVRICFVALKTGFPIEIFKLLGSIFAILVALHYYSRISEFITGRFSITVAPIEFMDFLIFILLVASAYSLFILLRISILNMVKIEAVSLLNKWGGLALGILRAVLTASLLCYILAICSVSYFPKSIKNSYFGYSLFKVSPGIYNAIWGSVVSKFSSTDRLNPQVKQTQEAISR
ncbi:MAG: CvpA family protein [Candidatus Omnitrophica bacterium]|jgi:uncharacterized membrane protein required for colicin V production|nr:CvpA family protein [Candidatus Omnitrophota bacterium]